MKKGESTYRAHKNRGFSRVERGILACALPLCAVLAFAVLSPQTSQAQVSTQELTKRVTTAKILPPTVSLSLTRDRDIILVTLSHYTVTDLRTQKVDGLLISRTVTHADPGTVSCVVVRFLSPTGAGYTDVVVSNREIVGADAGTMSTEDLIQAAATVVITGMESPESRFERYASAAEKELTRDDAREADYLLGCAYRECPALALKDSRYLEGQVKLADAYGGREDDAQEARIYQSLASSLLSASDVPPAMEALRDVYSYYKSKEDFTNAQPMAAKLVALQKDQSSPGDDYIADLEKLALANRKLGRLQEAKAGLEEALLLARQSHGDSNPFLASILESLGDCYAQEGNKKQAYEFFKQAKLMYDYAVANKDSKARIAYEVYEGIVKRIDLKMKALPH
jgi:hypothetical protein